MVFTQSDVGATKEKENSKVWYSICKGRERVWLSDYSGIRSHHVGV